VFLAPSGSRASRSLTYNPTAKGMPEQAWLLNTDTPTGSESQTDKFLARLSLGAAEPPGAVFHQDSITVSSAADAPVATRPRTRLLSGIRKEKVYIDGTVSYSLLTSSGDPQNLEEAVGDKN